MFECDTYERKSNLIDSLEILLWFLHENQALNEVNTKVKNLIKNI